MYRDEHEAALRRAEALEREVHELRATARTSAGVAERLAGLERELAERREQAAADARRLSDLQRRVDALRAEAAGGGVHVEPGIADCQTGILQRPPPARRAVAAAVALGAILVAGGAAAFWLLVSTAGSAASADDEDSPPAARAAPLVSTARDVRAHALYDEAMRLDAIGDAIAARELLEEAEGIFPALPDVHRALARYDLDEGAEDDACTELGLYLDLSPRAGDVAALRDELEGRCVDGSRSHSAQQ